MDAWKINDIMTSYSVYLFIFLFIHLFMFAENFCERRSQSTLLRTVQGRWQGKEGRMGSWRGGVFKGSRGGSREARAPHFTAPLMFPLWKHQAPRFTEPRRSPPFDGGLEKHNTSATFGVKWVRRGSPEGTARNVADHMSLSNYLFLKVWAFAMHLLNWTCCTLHFSSSEFPALL